MDFGDHHSAPKPEYTLPGVLDFLQRSWVQFELERARWHTEKAELMARVSQLEAERKGKDNIQRDLIRRIKMLEYAIQQERLRYSKTTGDQIPKQTTPAHVTAIKSSAPPTRLTQANARRDVLKKYLQEIGSENVLLVKTPPAFLMPSLLNKDTIAQLQSQTHTPNHSPQNHQHVNNNIAINANDKNQALTDHTTPPDNNNIPPQPSRSLAALKESLSSAVTIDDQKENITVPDVNALEAKLRSLEPPQQIPPATQEVPPPTPAVSKPPPAAAAAAKKDTAAELKGDEPTDAELAEMAEMQKMMGKMKFKGVALKNMLGVGGIGGGRGVKKPSGGGGGGGGGNHVGLDFFSPAPSSIKDEPPAVVAPTNNTNNNNTTNNNITTTTTNNNNGSSNNNSTQQPDTPKLAKELADLTLEDESPATATGSSQEPGTPRPWRSKYTLRSHFDAVRSVVFHPTENVLFSGSEDYTMKMWNLNSLAPQPKKGASASPELEPIYTFRGHTGPIYTMDIHADKGKVFSAGGDAVIRVWSIPPVTLDTYDKHGVGVDYRVMTIEGHTDAIWSIAHHPHRSHILSASADGTVRLWDHEKSSPLLLTLSFPNIPAPHAPTSVAIVQTDPHRCIASYTSSALAVFDLETGACVVSTQQPQDNTKKQINCVVTHPTLPLAITAHEDKKIEYFDLKSGKVVHSLVAHLDSVSSLAIDPSGLYLLSAGHDSSIRFWDVNTRNCVQEMNAHRPKYQESIHTVTYHPTRTFVASGGADSTVRVYM